MRELMLGNKAVARGMYEAGCKVISSYPGTPSTEITEEAAKYLRVTVIPLWGRCLILKKTGLMKNRT